MFKNFFFFIKGFRTHLINYPTSLLLNNNWCFGFSLGIFLVMQVITGLFLAAQYVSYSDLSFDNLEYIMRSINHGWFIRYLHSNGAAFFFILLYLHFFKAIFYKSYSRPRQLVWIVGVVIFLISILTAFTGYVLPWGQMSFWAATVITNLVTAIPVIGSKVVIWIWGDFAVGNGTLKKFFMIHFLLPFLLIFLVAIHLIFLHESKSNNSFALDSIHDNLLRFYPYFIIKDLVVFMTTLFFFCVTIFFFPNIMGHPDNFIKANPLVTPNHIVPEWYFLTFYAILRSIPDKSYGVLLMGCSIVVLFFLPLIDDFRTISHGLFNEIGSWSFSLFFFSTVSLAWAGAMTATEPYIMFSQLFVFLYFLFFIIIVLSAGFFGSLTNLFYFFIKLFALFFVRLIAFLYVLFFSICLFSFSFFDNLSGGDKDNGKGDKSDGEEDSDSEKKSSSGKKTGRKPKKSSVTLETKENSTKKTEKKLVESCTFINIPITYPNDSFEHDQELKSRIRFISVVQKKAKVVGDKLDDQAVVYKEKKDLVIEKQVAIENLKLSIIKQEKLLKETKENLKVSQKELTKPNNSLKRSLNSLGSKASIFIEQYTEFRRQVEIFKKSNNNIDFKVIAKNDVEKLSWLNSFSFENLSALAEEFEKKNK